MALINDVIVDVARSHIGVKEIGHNEGFDNEKFKNLLEQCEWQTGQAWCSYFFELVWMQAHSGLYQEKLALINELCSASAVRTFHNFRRSYDFRTDELPAAGCGVFWQRYKNGQPHWSGHAGIVVPPITNRTFYTVEGNTNMSGSREGDVVGNLRRLLNFTVKQNGLVLLGFVHPI